MVHTRPGLPAGHGELLVEPPVSEWPTLLRHALDHSKDRTFTIAGTPAEKFIADARSEALAAASSFSARLGVQVREPRPADEPIVMTGHQPELYHPGVWAKDFLLDRIAVQEGATAIDLVVDSDGFDTVELAAPCLEPVVRRCEHPLAVAAPGACFACAPVPSAGERAAFRQAGDDMLSSLKAPSVRRHFDEFCDSLDAAAGSARNLAELMTFARRMYESPAGTGYLELPVSELSRTSAYARFASHVVLNAERFAEQYNAELAEYRTFAKVRSAAQPFPDLDRDDGAVELPFWHLGDGRRRTVWARPERDGVRILADGEIVAWLPALPHEAGQALLESGVALAPKALVLTLYARMFLSDLFIHGVGGARYDRVTDGVARRFFGAEPPPFVTASLTVYLPLGAHLVSEQEVATAVERVNRFEHNPDALLGDVEFDSSDEWAAARRLAGQKAALVAQMSSSGVDKKALGLRIREVNAELRELLAPVGTELVAERDRLVRERETTEILTDRTYPYCLWSPEEIADKVT